MGSPPSARSRGARFGPVVAILLLGLTFADPGGGTGAPGSDAASAKRTEGAVKLAGPPEPYFHFVWTATADGFSDVTEPDGTRVVVRRTVELGGSVIVRRFPDGSQDSYSYELTLTDDYDRVETTPCVGAAGFDRTHIHRYVTDPLRYQGMDGSLGPILPPQQRPDGTWYLFDPFIRFYSGRFFTYTSDTEHDSCFGDREVDQFDVQAGFYADLAFPGDLEGGVDGVTFVKESSFVSPFSNDPPMNVHWSVTAQRLQGRDLTVDRLEVTQGLQSTANSIPLVRGRRTVVRAYIGIGREPGPVPGVTGILMGYAGGSPLGTIGPFNPGGQITAQASPNWMNINHTLNFQLPHHWTLEPSLRVVVKVNHTLFVDEINYNNNEREVSRATRDCRPVDLGYLSVKYDPGGQPAAEPDADIAQGHEFLRKIYPVADRELKYSPLAGLRFNTSLATDAGEGDLLRRLTARLLSTSAPRPEKLIGWIPQDAASNNGLANVPGVAAWVAQNKAPVNYWRGTFAHETAHTYGRQHTNQTTGGLHWFDVYERRIKPPRPGGNNLWDVITAVGEAESDRWISPATFNFLFGKLCPAGPALAALAARGGTVGDNLIVTGTVNNVVPATGSLDPLARTSTAPTEIPPPPEGGPGYCVNLKDSGGAVLAQYCFDVSFEVESTTPTTAASKPFGMVVPYPAGLSRVELIRGTGALLSFRAASASPPSVTLTSPTAPGLTLSGVQTVTWTASDPDANPLTYSLLYSPDNGVTWTGLDALITQTSSAIDFSQLPGGAAARIRVQASDGFHTAQDDSDNPFAVGEKPPLASIVSPPGGETFDAGTPVTLQGEGVDLEDGSLGDGALSWSSSRDGALGTGQLLEAPLSLGSHVITLTATDSDGQIATATVALTVTGTPPPAPGFYTVTPCRVADTRDPAGPLGGPALAAGVARTFQVGGRCSVPVTAKGVSFNFTITQPTAIGHVTIYPASVAPPLVSTMNFRPGLTRANNAIVALGPGGALTVVSGQPSGTVHLIVDVNGYFIE